MSTTAPPPPAAAPAPAPLRLSTARALARILPYAKPAMPWIYAGMVAALLAGVIALAIPLVLQSLVDGPLATGDPSQIWPAAIAVLVLGILEAVFIALRRFFVLTPGTHIEARMRNGLYAQLQDLPVAFHDRWQSGQLLSRAVSDLNLIRRWLSFGFVLLIVNGITIVIGFVVLFSWSLWLGLLFFVVSVPLWIYGYLFEQKYSVIARRAQDQQGDLATAVEESVHGIRVLKAFGRGTHSLLKFAEQAELLRATEIDKAKAIAGIWFWLVLIPDVAFALCLLGGVALAANGELSVGELFAFFATATVLRFPIESIGFLLAMTYDTRAATDRFFEVMDEVNTITDPAAPVSIEAPTGRLTFENVVFRYQDAPADQPGVLDGVTLELEPGETMALVGVTGSGKTTMTALATRLYDVTEGRVLLDGVDIRDLTREELRRHIAMAFEDATLFSASVRDNVLLGRPDLTESDDPADAAEAERVLAEALDIAQADFVHSLPDGVDTTVGEEGLSLSGGQRQRLALARAVAANPAVLVLDDPLSALDVDTEALVEAALRRVLATTTGLIVAHRPSTVQMADRVALLQEGRITDVGTHSELLKRNEHYRYVISSLEDEELAAAERVERDLKLAEQEGRRRDAIDREARVIDSASDGPRGEAAR
ncbi:ABC transporter ATP-binding protein [Microcella frigidaquae]|uniref:ATP-binding cassette subfamily B protein n=1 Tax=Microcella frigidaquae TaxID=424758 RepID=A0A840XP63_9MICO|nr:ABC transporter ATP-binding protein [Microcella frigidaquae]MBB5617709.1 ATP-binding cassette subfamily B protein [Microcella frigidaquae]NHN45728.1 ABC transporter ATP-binding protein [Microcella frigidaquae]